MLESKQNCIRVESILARNRSGEGMQILTRICNELQIRKLPYVIDEHRVILSGSACAAFLLIQNICSRYKSGCSGKVELEKTENQEKLGERLDDALKDFWMILCDG